MTLIDFQAIAQSLKDIVRKYQLMVIYLLTFSRISYLSRKNLNDYYWITIAFFLPWVFLLVSGDEQGRYTKETENFLNLSESMDI